MTKVYSKNLKCVRTKEGIFVKLEQKLNGFIFPEEALSIVQYWSHGTLVAKAKLTDDLSIPSNWKLIINAKYGRDKILEGIAVSWKATSDMCYWINYAVQGYD